MSNDSQGSVKGEVATIASPPESASSQAPPLSPSKPPELPDELVQAGWSKCWSRRENRPYYFNRFTNQSLWEVPVLGLNAAPAEGGDSNLGNGQRKRRNSEEQGAGPNSIKRPKVEPTTPISPSTPGLKPWSSAPEDKQAPPATPTTPSPAPAPYRPAIYWDLDVQTNAVIREHPPANHLHPHPEIELQRAQLVTKLRPRSRLTSPNVKTSVYHVKSKRGHERHSIRLARIKYKEEARKLLFKYAEAAKKMIDSRRNASPESRKVVKWNAEDTMSWLRRDHSASKEDYMVSRRLEHLRKQCGPHITAVAKDSVEGICSKIYSSLWKASGSPPQQRLVYCFPNDVACLRFKGEMVKVNRGHFSKLELLYRYSCIDDPRFEKFLTRVWCLLKRYQVLFGSGANEGSGLQGALPVPVFEALMRQFGVSFECFASPLNCYFKQFSSAFPDTDGYFGSRGPFLSFCPVSGSFEANPPFCEELMDAMVTHFEGLLEKSSEPLSFIVFVPEWRDPVTPALTRMEASRFLRHQMTVTAFEHEYRSGSQHICKRDEMYYRAVHGTAVIFLQNDAGFSKWAPTPERLAELTAAYQPSPSCPPPMSSPGPASTEKDSAPKPADRPQSAVMSPGSHDDNSNNTNSSSGPVEKVAAV
ncbi:mRNA (2'-O-methyladenosine-N(6)-)-methyltransferase [Dissostichus eleginoides]|uniref:mRNA (2'-O-methyladenosine-N(6)-)-methyltransferase n=1 Tax=Dissostichus eleginoides TaxID=100907 RepID=A0AAD9CGE7_DISEL|nr:mRNA (2'-O-methyladenosine-N(6)-)-methyltransferase [Dissostichus eleginoides]